MLLATALLIVGLLLVVYSADRLVFAASILCRTFGIPVSYTHLLPDTPWREALIGLAHIAVQRDR